jgi:hypothetical protein
MGAFKVLLQAASATNRREAEVEACLFFIAHCRSKIGRRSKAVRKRYFQTALPQLGSDISVQVHQVSCDGAVADALGAADIANAPSNPSLYLIDRDNALKWLNAIKTLLQKIESACKWEPSKDGNVTAEEKKLENDALENTLIEILMDSAVLHNLLRKIPSTFWKDLDTYFSRFYGEWASSSYTSALTCPPQEAHPRTTRTMQSRRLLMVGRNGILCWSLTNNLYRPRLRGYKLR